MSHILYADYEINSADMFVITPEGNYFRFDYPEYDETHESVMIIDPMSHKTYNVVFNE